MIGSGPGSVAAAAIVIGRGTGPARGPPRSWLQTGALMSDQPATRRSCSADEVVSQLRSGMNVFVHGGSATPTTLLEAMARRTDLEGVRLYHLHLMGPLAFTAPEHAGRFTSVSLFTGPGCRAPIAEGRAEYVPIFLSDIPSLFASGAVRLDAALVQLSPPDRHGLCTLGTSVDAARSAVDHATLVLAEVNARMPRTHGHSAVPLHRPDAHVTTDRPLHEHPPEPETPEVARIGELIADLVADGDCLQHEGCQSRERLLADTFHLVEVLDLTEGPILGPVLDDALGHRRTDQRQRLELGLRGHVQVDFGAGDSRRRRG